MRRTLRATVLLLAMSASTSAVAQLSCTVHYSCTSAQCASIMGGYNVTKGPFSFASESSCLSQARQQMTNARCSCRSAGSASSGSAPGAASSGNETAGQAAANAANRVIGAGNFNTANNAAMTMGAGVATGLAVFAIRSAMEGPSAAELARRAVVRQEQLRLQQEAEERARREAEERHRRIVAGLQGATLSAESTPRLAGANDVKLDSPLATAGNLALLKTDAAPAPQGFAQSGSRWSAGPADPPPSPGGNLAFLKRADDNLEAASDAARKPFDTAGALTLPAPPVVASAAAGVAAPGAVPSATPLAAPTSTGSSGDDGSSIMANRKPRPEIRIAGGVDRPGPLYRPGSGPAPAEGAQQQVASAPAAAPAPPPPNAAPTGAQQAAYQRGYREAMGCTSQNAANACTGSSSAQDSLACMQSYQAGYAAAAGFRDSLLQGVETSGRLDKQNGQGRGATPINPQLDAGCRIESLQAYNRGYGL